MQADEFLVNAIRMECTQDNAEVRAAFVSEFKVQADAFASNMGEAAIIWESLDDQVQGNVNKALVSALAYSAIHLHILSMKLLLSGYFIAAGNLLRQVLETMALSFLCSNQALGFLGRYQSKKYKSNKAVRDVLKHGMALGLNDDSLRILKSAHESCHKYSHPTLITLAAHMASSGSGVYVGASFDPGKLDLYTKEVEDRLSLAQVFSSFVHGVTNNLANW